MTPSKFSTNIAWNILGQGAPILAAVVSIPYLIHEIGDAKFGMLTMAWMLIGYFSLFDFGIGRALTQLVSQRLAAQRTADILPLIWTGKLMMLVLGVGAGVALAALSDKIAYSWLNIPANLRAEAAASLLVIAPAIPVTVFTTGLRGVLEAYQEFRAINLLRIPLGILMFVAPIAALPFSHSLVAIFLALTIARLVTTLGFVWLCSRKIPSYWRISFKRAEVPVLLGFGGWMTVSNVIGPIMVQMDRFFIGSMMTISAVTYYTTPFEIMAKMLLLPASISGVAFTTFARLQGTNNREAVKLTYRRSLLYCSVLAVPVLVAIIGADWILKFWLGVEFARNSSLVMQIMAVGILINGLAHIPFAYIQGMGRPDITAQLHMMELVIYIPLLVLLIRHMGIAGAALAWLIRVSIDAGALFLVAHRAMRR